MNNKMLATNNDLLGPVLMTVPHETNIAYVSDTPAGKGLGLSHSMNSDPGRLASKGSAENTTGEEVQ